MRMIPVVVGLAAVLCKGAAAQGVSPKVPERAVVCAGCHGENGNSTMPLIPSLAGQPAFYVTTQLILMREGVRPVPVMTPFVEKLTDAEVGALAAYFAGLTLQKTTETADPALIVHGANLAAQMRCSSCHLPSLLGQEQMPRIAGQRIDYMVDALKAYRDSSRAGADPLMSNAVAGVSDADLTALAHYAASR